MSSRDVKFLAGIGALALFSGVVALAIGAWMLKSGFSARPPPSALEERVALTLRKLAVPSRYESMTNPVEVNEAVLHEATAHWADHCAGCHANDGSGRTGMGEKMYPRPPDMRGARTQRMSDGELYYVINEGIRFTGMPAWGRPGDDDAASWALVAFIRTLPSLTAEQVEAMRDLNPVPASVVKARQEEDDFLNGEDSQPPVERH